jgi:hypothetical protein
LLLLLRNIKNMFGPAKALSACIMPVRANASTIAAVFSFRGPTTRVL